MIIDPLAKQARELESAGRTDNLAEPVALLNPLLAREGRGEGG